MIKLLRNRINKPINYENNLYNIVKTTIDIINNSSNKYLQLYIKKY